MTHADSLRPPLKSILHPSLFFPFITVEEDDDCFGVTSCHGGCPRIMPRVAATSLTLADGEPEESYFSHIAVHWT